MQATLPQGIHYANEKFMQVPRWDKVKGLFITNRAKSETPPLRVPLKPSFNLNVLQYTR